VTRGATLLLDDGRIEMWVEEVQGDEVHCKVVQGGVLSNNKGINRKGGGLSASALTEKDIEDIKTAAAIKADYLAVSFPRSAADIQQAREILRAAGGGPGSWPRSSGRKPSTRWMKSSTPPTPSWWPGATWAWRWATPPCPPCRSA
jgi:hypothetical protein